jgi:hypothetical protein
MTLERKHYYIKGNLTDTPQSVTPREPHCRVIFYLEYFSIELNSNALEHESQGSRWSLLIITSQDENLMQEYFKRKN